MTNQTLIQYWENLAKERYDSNKHMMFLDREEYINDYIEARDIEFQIVQLRIKFERARQLKDLAGRVC